MIGAAFEVWDGIGSGNDLGALVVGRQKIVGKDLGAGVGQFWGDDDERGQVLIVGSEAITYPGPDTGSGKSNGAGVDAEGGLEMVAVVGFHGTYETDVIHTFGDVGEQIGDFCPAFSARRGVPEALEEFVFSVQLFEFGFGVEGIDV